jgi:trehalose 6-phosphate synthase/phosphatase
MSASTTAGNSARKAASAGASTGTSGVHGLVVVANRLPVDRRTGPDGTPSWQPSPGGLVAALEPVLRGRQGVWIGWNGSHEDAGEEFDAQGMHLVPLPLSVAEIEDYYEGMSNATLWPLYHDVIAPPVFHRHWWEVYAAVNRRFAQAAAAQAAPHATVWVQDYQLQLVPAMLRAVRPDLRIGFFNHIPFPPYEIYSQLPWRKQLVDGLLGADLLGFQRPADANNMLRACRRLGIATRRGMAVIPDQDGVRQVRCAAFPISVDAARLDRIAREPGVIQRAKEIRHELGDPKLVLLGVDRLDYTKGIRHRFEAVGELFDEGRLSTPEAVFVQVASPSRERVSTYRSLREEVEVVVGRINGLHGQLGHPAVHYLHQSIPREELTALYLAADVMLVTALRDGMNLVAKEYVASRHDDQGALVLSEFTGAANELTQAHLVNPHDIDGMKDVIMRAVHTPASQATRRMRALRRQVFGHDVGRWASEFLTALGNSGPRVPAVPDRLHQALVDLSARELILIACDFDGVLAPLVDRPPDARPLPASVVALQRLAALPRTHVVLVSGRSLESLRHAAQPPGEFLLIGGHGSESATGHLLIDRGSSMGGEQAALATRVAAALVEIAAAHPGAHTENKPASSTLHTRGLPREVAARAEQAVLAGPASWDGVHLLRGKDVLELSVSTATKGSALLALAERLGISAGGVLYLGDDVTDEDAFAALDTGAGDVGIKVGDGETVAAYRVSGTESVSDLLQWLAGLRVEAIGPGE